MTRSAPLPHHPLRPHSERAPRRSSALSRAASRRALPLVVAIAALFAAAPAAAAAVPLASELGSASATPHAWTAAATVDRPLRPEARRGATVAMVVAPVTARRSPRASARAVWRVPTATGWSRQRQVLLVRGSARDADGRRWLRVELPIRPNGTSGWIRADYARLRTTPYWIDVSTGRRLVTVYRDGRVARRFSAVVGTAGTPTPHGLFAVWEKNPQPDPHGFIGPWALPLTALSDVLERYGGGPGRVAIHGRAGLSLLDPLGTAASHGCIRVANADVLWLAHRIPHGTPVDVHR